MHVSAFRHSKYVFCFIALALVGASCASKPKLEVYPTKGTVLVKDKPAAGVRLTFFPAVAGDPMATRPVAKTAEDGSFSVVTDDEDGAPAGDYVVTMVWMQEAAAPTVKKGDAVSMRMNADPVDKLGGKYRERQNGFKVTIKKGDNELPPFKLP